MNATLCAKCKTEYDLAVSQAFGGACAIPDCRGELVDPRAAPSPLDAASVALAAVGLAAAVIGLFGYGWAAFDWVPLAGTAAGLAVGGFALTLGRRSPRSATGRGLAFVTLALAYPPVVAITGIFVGISALVLLYGLTLQPPAARAARAVERSL